MKKTLARCKTEEDAVTAEHGEIVDYAEKKCRTNGWNRCRQGVNNPG